MSKKRTRPEHATDAAREYMRNYMRKYRKAKREGIARTPSANMPGPLAAQSRKRMAEWYLENRERKIAYVTAYAAVNRAKSNQWKREWRERNRPTCPFCSTKTWRGATSCAGCLNHFGRPCKGNESCAVPGVHKHCPSCSMPVVPKTRQRQLEECAFCVADRARGAHMGTRESDSGQEDLAA